MLTIEHCLTHAEETVQRYNEFERWFEKARPELDELRRELAVAEDLMQKESRARESDKERHRLEVEDLRRQLAFASRPWIQRLLNRA